MGVNSFIKIGTTIKHYRQVLGVSQVFMAEQLGIQRSTYSNYENNIREPKEEMILNIAAILGVSVEKLLETPSNLRITEVPEDIVYWARKHQDVIIPTKRDEDACYDLYAYFPENYMVIQPHETKMIPTGLFCALNKKWKLELEERGSTGTKGIGQRAGQVDSGYRGEIMIPITNHNVKPLIIYKGTTWVAEATEETAILYPYSKAICQASIVEVPVMEEVELDLETLQAIPSARKDGKLGSSQK